MPELPEVETVMRGLQAVLEHERIAWAETRRDGMRFPFPPRLADRLRGRRVLGFRRRAKYILMRLEGGESLLIHLGMSGRMVARREGAPVVPRQGKQGVFSDARGHNAPPEAHEHLAFGTEGGWHIGFVDPRRFGSVDLVATDAEDQHKLLAIKAALLDQRVIAGLGNIYVCEALYRAGISPRRSAHTVAGARAGRLAPAIKAVLQEAIAAGGSSLRDYVRADGEIGRFQENFAVYGREGEACPGCPGQPECAGIKRIVQSGRSSFFCPIKQR
ncbi:MAG: Fpg/Nei family DNA glycosylase [Acetobacteraceae bacterium]|nr:Fpg/Nei family DNA glycosylase [Acetobacteraceae bacterium]